MGKVISGPDLWAAGGPVSAAYEAAGFSYRPRAEQQRMAAIIEETLGRQDAHPVGMSMVESGTGTGKTLAYLVPGCLHAVSLGRSIMVSTHTIALGEQILRKDGPIVMAVVEQLTGRKISIAHMRGRRHFVSPSRCRAIGNLLRDDNAPPSHWQHFFTIAERAENAMAFAQKIYQKETIMGVEAQDLIDSCLLDVIEEDIGIPLPKEDISLLSTSPEYELTIYNLSKARASRATLLVTTHAFTAISLARQALMGAEIVPFDLLVVDEADQWANAAASVSLISVSLSELLRSVEAIREASRHSKAKDDIDGIAQQSISIISGMMEAAPKLPNYSRAIAESDPIINQVHDLTRSLGSLAKEAAKRRSHTAAAADAMKEKIDDLRRILRAVSSNETSFWQAKWTTSRVKGLPSIAVGGRAPGRILKRLWNNEDTGPLARSIVLTSATLSTPGYSDASKWNSITFATGADPSSGMLFSDISAIIHPENFGEMQVRFADPRAPLPHIGDQEAPSPEALDYMASVIKAAHGNSLARNGRTLVLVPSYNDAAELARRVPGSIEHHQGTPLRKILDVYRTTANCCLITPAAWAGIDLPGLIQNLVIPRIPFAPGSSGGGDKFAQLLSETMIKLAQGIGRGIRRPDDKITVWFADPRMPVPDSITEETGLMASPAAKPILLAAIPERFRKEFGKDPDAAKIGVLYTKQQTAKREASKNFSPKRKPVQRAQKARAAGRGR